MLVVATAEGTVTVYDESVPGPDGVGWQEVHKFRVMINYGTSTKPEWYTCCARSPIAAVSVNGTVIAMKDSMCGFSTWDITTGVFLRRFVGHDDSTCMSEDKIACKCVPGLHEWKGEQCLAPGHGDVITAMAISPIGDRIVSADAAGDIIFWDAATAVVLQVTSMPFSKVIAISFSPDGEFFVVTNAEGFAFQHRTKNIRDYQCPFTPSNTAHSRCEMRAVAWTPDSTQYICGYERGQVKSAHKDGPDGSDDAPCDFLHLGRSADIINALATSPDGFSVAVAGGREIRELGNWVWVRGFVAVYNSANYTLRWKEWAEPEHDGLVTSLSFSFDGKQLVSAGDDKYVRMWDPRDGSRLKAFRQYELPIPRRHSSEYYPSEVSASIKAAALITCTSYTSTQKFEETPEKHEKRIAWAQGHHKRLGATSILQILSPDLMRLLGRMV
jgi:WD40 repeat protein